MRKGRLKGIRLKAEGSRRQLKIHYPALHKIAETGECSICPVYFGPNRGGQAFPVDQEGYPWEEGICARAEGICEARLEKEEQS